MKAQYQQAMGLFQARKYPEAEARFREILLLEPGEVNSSRMLGVTLASRGQLDEADALLEDVVHRAPGFLLAYIDLALVKSQQNRLDEAILTLNDVLKQSPEFPPAVNLLKELQVKRSGTARPGSYGAASIDERDPVALLRRAIWLFSNGDADQAQALYKKVLVLDPKKYHAHVGLAGIAQDKGELEKAEAHLQDAARIDANAASIRNGFARLYDLMVYAYKKERNGPKVEEAARKLVVYDADNAASWSILGGVLAEDLNMPESLEAFDKSLSIDPRQPATLLYRGHVLKALGRRNECDASYRASLDLDPGLGEVWWSLANLKNFNFSQADIQTMVANLDGANHDAKNEAHLHFALGKACEDEGHWEKSFEHYLVGNRIKDELSNFHMKSFKDKCDRARTVFTPELFADKASRKIFDVTPIFIVGLPRSGSTLLEQILASHSQVQGTMELTNISNKVVHIDRGEGRRDAYPEHILEMSREDFEDLGEKFIEETRDYYEKGASYFIDKLPNNFTYVGLIKLMIPQAVIIDARRHPVDCCFGNFKQHFAEHQEFTYSFENIAAYYDIYLEMMSHWNEVLPGQIHLMQHEDIVSDSDTQIRKLLDDCGLKFEEQCLKFYETDRVVFTASSEQVREPINSKGVGKWKNYESQLEPLIDLLDDALKKYREI